MAEKLAPEAEALKAADGSGQPAGDESAGGMSRASVGVGAMMGIATASDRSNSVSGLRARLWRVDEGRWRRFSGQPAEGEEDEKSRMNNVSAAFDTSVHVPKRSNRDTSLCGLPVIDPYHWLVNLWTRLVFVFDMSYTAFLVPVSVGFQTSERHSWNAIIDTVAGIIFVLALVMGFHIGFIAQHNLRRSVVTNGRHVAEYYMQCGSFAIDVLSVLVYIIQIVMFLVRAIAGIDESNLAVFWVINALQVLRMVRLCSVLRVVKYLLISASTGGSHMLRRWLKPVILYSGVIVYMLAFVVVVTASLWFFVGSWYAYYNYDNWIAKFIGEAEPCSVVFFEWQFPNPNIPEECNGNTVMHFGEAFSLSIYWSVTTLTTVGYGDVTPSNIGEVVIAIIVMLMGIMSFAVLIGSMQEVFKTASETAKNVSALREKLEAVNRWLQLRRIPTAIQAQIRRFYHEAWLQREQNYMESSIFEELPHQLRAVVAQHQTAALLSEMRVFGALSPEERRIVASKLVPVTLGVGQDICCQGDLADRMWILQEGSMVAIYGDKAAEREKAPALICETAILADVDVQFDVRPCGFRAATNCILWELKMRDLRAVVGQFPDLKPTLNREVSVHVLQRAGLYPDAMGAYNLDVVRQASRSLQASVKADLQHGGGEADAAREACSSSMSLAGVGEVGPQCLRALAEQVNCAVLGSPEGGPLSPCKEEREDYMESEEGEKEKGESPPKRFAAVNVRMPSEKQTDAVLPEDPHPADSPTDVSAALKEALLYIKGMEARVSEMEAASPTTAGSPMPLRNGSPVKRLGSSGASGPQFTQLRM